MRRTLALALVVMLAPAAHTTSATDLLPAFAPHPPILIDGDAGFLLPTSGVSGPIGASPEPFVVNGIPLP